MASRADKTKKAVELLSMFAGYNDSVKETESMLKALTDKQFDDYIRKLASGDEILPYTSPNFDKKNRITTEVNLKIAKKLGYEFFEQLYLTDPATGITSLTPEKYLVVDFPLKLLQQNFDSKVQIPKDNRHVDERTGQVAGKSKGSGMSAPELTMVNSQGLSSTIGELFRMRGGDDEANRLVEQTVTVDGLPTQAAMGDSRTTAAITFDTYMKSAMYGSNF